MRRRNTEKETRAATLDVFRYKRTGVRFDRSDVRRSEGYCESLTALIRKARASGDGTFYLPIDQWPAETEHLELRKPWVVMS